MGHEYTAQLPGFNKQHIMQAVDKLLETRRYEVEGQAAAMVTLRYAEAARRDDWPEDVAIAMTERGVLLTVHAGTRHQQKTLIRDLEAALQAAGFADVLFEEL